MDEIVLRHGLGQTRIRRVPDLIEDPGPILERVPCAAVLYLLSDDHVGPIWGRRLAGALERAGRRVETVVLPSGEENKNWATVVAALDQVLEAGLRRDDRVLALGGGVLGDEAGLVALLALRGVPILQLPTTLLAMVDSSVGGKVGVDHPTGKNRVGGFHHPETVLVCLRFLETLPPRELRAGFVEVIKAALLAGADELEEVERYLDAPTADALARLVEMALRLKVRLVEQDEREGGVRQLLNLGHTLGHALEAATGYRRFLHGEAVAWGLLAALRLSVRLDLMAAAEADRIGELVHRAVPRPAVSDLDFPCLAPLLAFDKKNLRSGSRWVVLRTVGEPQIVTEPDLALLAQAWEDVLRQPWPESGNRRPADL